MSFTLTDLCLDVLHTHVHTRLLLVGSFIRYLKVTKLSYMGGVLPLFILVHDPLDCCHVTQSKPYTILLEYSTNPRYFILLLNILL
jgi:hypothetical protein